MESFMTAYVIFNVFLLLFGAYIFWKVTPDLVKKSEYATFKMFIAVYCVYLAMNTLWSLQEYDVIALPHWMFVGVCYLSLLTVVLNAYCFYVYTLIHFEFKSIVNSRKANICSVSSVGVAFVLLTVSLFNGVVFSVTEDEHIVTGPLYIALPICAFIYFAVIIGVSINKAVKTHSPGARRWAIGVTLLVVFLIFWVVLDNYIDRITIIPVAIFAIILSLFVSMQRSGIYTDALTGLNNRRRAEEYLSSLLLGLSETECFYVYIIDINSFKSINDRYGHSEGDAALILMADAAKRIVTEHGGFAARYGGDEFVIVWKPARKDDTNPENITAELKRELSTLVKKDEKPYKMSFSAGFVRCSDRNKSIGSYIKDADEILYENKRAFHAKDERAS